MTDQNSFGRDSSSVDADARVHDAPDAPVVDAPRHDLAPSSDAAEWSADRSVSSDAAVNEASAQDGPARDGAAHDGPARDTAAHDGPAHDGPAHDGSARDSAAHDGPARGDASPSEPVHGGPAGPAGHVPDRAVSEGPVRPGAAAQVGVGPFSVREVALLGVWVVAFFVSFFRTNILDSPSGVLVGGANVWLSGLWWIPAIALPTVAVGLITLRRLSPQGIRRVGSLGIDQFASVAFAISALVWVSWVWDTVAVFGDTGIWTRSWVIWVEAVLLLAGVVLTVAAPFIPPFSDDFRDREEIAAHRNARPIRPVVSRPRTPRAPRTPAAHASAAHDSASPETTAAEAHVDEAPVPGTYTGSTDLSHDAAPATAVFPAHNAADDTDVFAPLHSDAPRDTDAAGPAHAGYAHAEHAHAEHAHAEHDRHDDHDRYDDHRHAQAFWALAPVEREIVDDYGTPIFTIGPTAWALAIEDRGETFVIRHDDGRIGYLHDVSGVTRG